MLRSSDLYFPIKWTLLLGLFAGLTACGGNKTQTPTPPPVVVTPPPANQAPVADAGPDATYDIASSTYTLDASGSSDPDGDRLTFGWTLESQPAGANAGLVDPDQAVAGFRAMTPGEYIFKIAVSDPSRDSDYDEVVVTLVNTAPTAVIGAPSPTPFVGRDITLNASNSTDPNGQTLSYSWTVVSTPGLSTLSGRNYSGPAPIITFDQAGQFELELSVTDGIATTTTRTGPIEVQAWQVLPLAVLYNHLAHDTANDRIAAANDTRFSVIDLDGTENSMAISAPATDVAVTPDGLYAIIGHDRLLSYVEMSGPSIVRTVPLPVKVHDIVVDADGFAFIFPDAGSQDDIYTVELATGQVTASSDPAFTTRSRAVISEDGNALFAVSPDLTLKWLQRYNVAADNRVTAQQPRTLLRTNDCADLWSGLSGPHLLTRCGEQLRVTTGVDATSLSMLDTPDRIFHASASPFTRQWAVIGDTTAHFVYLIDADTGDVTTPLRLPLELDRNFVSSSPTYAFSGQTNDNLYIVKRKLETQPNGDIVRTDVLAISYGRATEAAAVTPQAVVARYHSARVGDSVSIDASASLSPTNPGLTYQWTVFETPAGSVAPVNGLATDTIRLEPDVEGSYIFDLVVDDGVRSSDSVRVFVDVYPAGGPSIARRVENWSTGLSRPQTNITRQQAFRRQGSARYSAPLNAMLLMTTDFKTMKMLYLDDFREVEIALPRDVYQFEISDDGLFAVASHVGSTSLIDLSSATLADWQEHGHDWGEIVIDANRRAHFVPYSSVQGQGISLISVDFGANIVAIDPIGQTVQGPQLNPAGPWLYIGGPDIKFDLTAFPPTRFTDPPSNLGPVTMSARAFFDTLGNVYIGDLMEMGRSTLARMTDGASRGFSFRGALGGTFASWADYSVQRAEWAIITPEGVDQDGRTIYFADEQLNLLRDQGWGRFPEAARPGIALVNSAAQAFFNADGTKMIVTVSARERGGFILGNKSAIFVTDIQ